MPTHYPTYSPPHSVVVASTANVSMVPVSTKFQIYSTYESTDPETTFEWSAWSLTSGESLSLVYGETTLTPSAIDTLVLKVINPRSCYPIPRPTPLPQPL